MILNSIEFLSVLYVVFSSFVIINWRVLLSAFYIFLFTIGLFFGILLSTSFTFASKMDYFTKSLVYKITNICFFIFNILTFINKVSVFFLLNCLCLGFYFPLLLFDVVLNNITKFYKKFWKCFQRVYITFQRFLASTSRKYSCINTSCSLDL